ncbi:aspartate/glutamate racemase family protein [Chloroflexota bacterium]
MKIWIQSGSALATDSTNMYGSQYEQSLKKHFQEVARPGTTIELFGTERTPPGKDRYNSSTHLVTSSIIRSAIRAEEEGYDVIAIVSTLDLGYDEIRELVDIPVVAITESSCYLSCLLASKFAFLPHNQKLLLRMTEMVKKFGLTERMVPGRHLNITYEDFPNMYKDPEPYINKFSEEARKVIEQGADILMIMGNPTNMFMVDQGVKEIDGVPILDVCGAVIKIAELVVDLKQMGINRSKQGLLAAPSPEEIAQLRKFYND